MGGAGGFLFCRILARAAMASSDLFLKIDGIEGESQDAKHKGELQILTFSKSVHHTVGGAQGQDAGLSTWQDATFSMRMDKGYPKLFQACVNGDHLGKALLTFRKAGREQQEFLKITFFDVLISRCSINGGQKGDPTPLVTISFNFARIEEEYRTQQAGGALTGAIKYSYSIPKASKGQ